MFRCTMLRTITPSWLKYLNIMYQIKFCITTKPCPTDSGWQNWQTRALKISAAMSLLKWYINMARRRLGWHPNGSREAPCLSYTCLAQVFSFGNKQLCYVLTSNSDIVIKNNCSKITRNLDRSRLNKLKLKIYLNASKNNHFFKNQELLPWITNGCHRR